MLSHSKSSSARSLRKTVLFICPNISGNDLTQIDFFPKGSNIIPNLSKSSLKSNTTVVRS